MDKNQLISGIHTLVSNNVIGPKELQSRYKGFKGELYLDNFIKEKYPKFKTLDGGIIVSKDSNQSSLDNSIYFTITNNQESIDDYIKIYERLSKIGFIKMFIVFYEDNNWVQKPVMKFPDETINLLIPDTVIKEFDIIKNQFIDTDNKIETITDFFINREPRGRNKESIGNEHLELLHKNLNIFERSQLLKIYMDRLFLDGYIGFSKERGKPSDIDMILERPDGKFVLIEVKEKDLPRGGKIGFGLDVPRLKDFIRIQESSITKYILIVRHVNNQTERELVGWKYIPITTFRNDVVNQRTVIGGTGMRGGNSINETLICSLDLFKDF